MTWDITGLGATANIGENPEAIYRALCTGTETRTPLTAFNPARYRARYAYEIDDRASGADEPLRATKWLTTAVRQALTDAGLPEDLTGIPVLVGTTMREQRSTELWWTGAAHLGPDDLHFRGAVRKSFGALRVHTFANACAASLYALGMAADMIGLGLADTVVVAGTDAMTESAFGTLDKVQSDLPEALRPFDVSHKGMLMGEGAVAVVLRRTGSHSQLPHARLKSVSLNCDAFHPTAPDRNGIRAAVGEAHERAGVTPADIDLVMLHGSGTVRNDETEAAVMADVFAARGHHPPMTAIKSMTGHTLGGSGLLSLVMALLAMRHQAVPPVLGLNDPIKEATGLALVRDRAARATIRTAQVNAFGFGGINAVAIVEAAR